MDRGSVSWFTRLPVKEEPAGSIPAPGARYLVVEKSEESPLRSSLECSPPCQGGDRGFESHRGRYQRDLTFWMDRRVAEWQTRGSQTPVPTQSGVGVQLSLRRLESFSSSSREWQVPARLS